MSIDGTPLSKGAQALAARILGELGGCIGRGSTGSVYLSFLLSGKRWQVAVKQAEVGSLIDEYQALCQLQGSDYVVNLLFGFSTQEHDYIVLERLGADLLTKREEAANEEAVDEVDVNEVLNDLLDLAFGVCHIHDAGWIHHDVKSANLAPTISGRLKYLDFGNCTNGYNSTWCTTPVYTSPETLPRVRKTQHGVAFDRHLETPITPKADIWGIGVVLYEMLTRSLPFTYKRSKDTFAVYCDLFDKIREMSPDTLPLQRLQQNNPGWVGVLVAKLSALCTDHMLVPLQERIDANHLRLRILLLRWWASATSQTSG